MSTHFDVADCARDLSAVLRNRGSFEKLVRQTQWTKGPLVVLGSGASRLAGLAAARAFEWLLGWQVAVREPVEFVKYVLPALRPRSVVIAVSPSGEDEDLVDAVRRVRQRGATALAVTANTESSAARTAHAVFVLPYAEAMPPAPRTCFIEHATLLYIAVIAAAIFNPQHPLAGNWQEEFESLPGRLEWMRAHLSDAVVSARKAVEQAQRTIVAAGGLYHPAALQAERLSWRNPGRCTLVFEPYPLLDGAPGGLNEADLALILSGSNCRIKQGVHAAAERLEQRKVRIFSVTDSNDRKLVESSQVAILLPVLSEVAGSLLEVAFVQWVFSEAQRERQRKGPAPMPAPGKGAHG
jgi:D-arabinose 5-phosphate isomerase GutQ